MMDEESKYSLIIWKNMPEYPVDDNLLKNPIGRIIDTGRNNKLCVDIIYQEAKEAQTSLRRVEPMRLYRKMWGGSSKNYFIAYCHVAEEDRNFRFDRVIQATLTDQPYNRPAKPLITLYEGKDIPFPERERRSIIQLFLSLLPYILIIMIISYSQR